MVGNAGPRGALVRVDGDGDVVAPHNEAIVFSRSSSWIDLFLLVAPGETPTPPIDPRDVVHKSSNPPPDGFGFGAAAEDAVLEEFKV